MLAALDRAAIAAGRRAVVHLKVVVGMGRIGIEPGEAARLLELCRGYRAISVRGLMSHMPRADEADKGFSQDQIERFRAVVEETKAFGIRIRHMGNSAAIFDLPDAHFDAARPGISIYGLRPSPETLNPRVADRRPVLEWKTKVTFLKEVPTGQGLSYGDGLSRGLSNKLDVLVGGRRCPQVGRITMDQSLIDVTALRGRVAPGDEVVLIGRQSSEEITADELAARLGTINYEIVTAIVARVPRIAKSA
jgi:alanine racemase